ncbi:MAG: DUF3572 domain-containing protein [Rhodobacteraceae bacterium]|nr:DUF3572 domain-containing protein [Paracoccaceae bacterium]MCY4137821.1 DUF3572 domain-containing protein [Paracoccaceae bacterium]
MNMKRSREDAELMAIRAFEWVASDSALLGRFLNETGASLSEVRDVMDDREFLAAVLDFLMTDDRYIKRFSDHLGLSYDEIAEFRASLPGGNLPHWT